MINLTFNNAVTTSETTASLFNDTIPDKTISVCNNAVTVSNKNNSTFDTMLEIQHALELTWKNIFIGIVLYIIVLVTLIGNILVLLAVYVNKRLQTKFNYYIVNLAITDVAVAVTAMSFHTTDNFLGYWPFGGFLCGVWIFFDYGMTFVSVFTLVLISADRFWGVSWSLHYRRHHSKRKTVIAIVIMWLFMFALWLPPCIHDRLHNAKAGECIWEPSLNKDFVVVVAVVGHHGSCFIMLFCYIKVFLFMCQRDQEMMLESKTNKTEISVVDVDQKNSSLPYPDEHIDAHITSSASGKVPGDVKACYSQEKQAGSTNRTQIKDDRFMQKPYNIDNFRRIKRDRMHSHRQKSDRAIFVKLTYVIIGYAVCWIPFHVVFDISSLCPSCVSRGVYDVAFWMTYINSTINPFLYNFSAPEFRRTFKRLLRIKMTSNSNIPVAQTILRYEDVSESSHSVNTHM